MDLDLLQRLIRSRLPLFLDDPSDIAAFKQLREGKLVTGSIEAGSDGPEAASVESVTPYGRAFVAIRQSAHGKLSDNSPLFEDSK